MAAPAADRVLHLLNGDATADKLARAGLPGTLAVWADVLYEGPVPADRGSEAGREVRARFLASRGYTSLADALDTLGRWDARLDALEGFDEVVVWLEHDLFDQLLLIHHLHRFSRGLPEGTRASLLCVGEHPEVEPFLGLGQLSPEQLAALFEAREAIGEAEREIGRAAWEAFTSPDPLDLERLLERDLSRLPFLAPALRRLLEEYPATGTGLSRTERQLLEIASAGPLRALELLRALHRRERWYFVTDASLLSLLDELSAGDRPLLRVEGEASEGPLEARVSATEAGREVLAGREDRARLAGIDRWLGGVHLREPGPGWRWDPSAARLVRSG